MKLKKITLDFQMYERLKGKGILIPIDDYEEYRKIELNKPLDAKIKEARNYQRLKMYWCVLQTAIDNGIMDRLPIQNTVIESLVFQHKSEREALHYIMKWLHLPLVTQTMPDGSIVRNVSSIALDSDKNESEIAIYMDKVFTDISERLGTEKEKLIANSK